MRRPHQLQLSRGVGLLDALIALAILSFGLLALTQLQGRLIGQTTEAGSRQVAAQVGDELMGMILVDARNAACYTLPQVGTCASTPARTATTAWATRAAAALPGTVTTSSVLDTALGRLTLVITWTGKQTTDTRRLEVTTDVRS